MVLPTPIRRTHAADDATISVTIDTHPREYRLVNPTRIGSDSRCEIRLGGRDVHRRHCTILQSAGEWLLCVEAGVQHVRVNGQAPSNAPLVDGDTIDVAGVPILFHQPGPGGLSKKATAPQPSDCLDSGNIRRPAAVSHFPHSASPLPTPRAMDSPAPVDAVHPLRAVATDIAYRYATLDSARAQLDADRDSWQAQVARDRKLLDERRQALQAQVDGAWSRWKEERSQAHREMAEVRINLDRRSRELTIAEDKLKARIERDSAELQCRLAELERARTVAQQEWETARDARQASARLVHKLRRRESELNQRSQKLDAEQSRLESVRTRLEHDIDVRRHELDSLVHRVGVERAVLTDLQTMRILPAEAPPEPAAPQSAIDQLAELEHIAASLESLLHPVEQAWQQWTSSHELLLQDRRRLAQCAAQLASPTEAPTPPTPSADPAASAQQDLLERRIEQLEGDRAKLLIDRSVWEETRDAEKTAIERAQQRIRSARLRSALAHRARSARLREQRQQLAADQRRLTAKIGEMLRLEARLQITKRCLAEERLLQAEASARRDSLEAPARTPFDASERVENLRRNLEADWASYKGRLEQSLDALSSLRSQPATASIARSANRLEESLALLQMEKDELARHANVERDRHQAEVDRLRDQIESLAASLIDPPRAAA